MTLRQQFSILTSLLVIVLWLGNLLVTVMNGRDYFQQQLNGRAYDAATSLALSMSQVDTRDDVQLSRLIDVLFDRGFFEAIEFIRIDGEPLHRRARQALAQQPAPQWFMQWVDLDLVPAEADVSRGWQRLGTIRVVSHSDFAYRDLWAMVRAELVWFAWVLVISLVALHLLLGWLFRPLKRVEQQALAICEKEWQEQEDIPKARELRRMVLAMNKMVRKLRSIFEEQSAMAEQLREESFHDGVTGLLNRRGFDQRFGHILESEAEHSGVLMLLQLKGFAEFNQQYGREEGDERLRNLAAGMERWRATHQNALVGRRSGADFALFVPCADQHQADDLMRQTFSELASGVLSQRSEQAGELLVFHMGAVFLQAEKEAIQPALMKADAALRQAQRHPEARAQLYGHQGEQQEWAAFQWQQLLQDVLHNRAIQLQFMPVVSNRDQQLLQYEVFSRIEWQGEVLSAARFWPMVEQHQMAAAYDLCIIEQVLEKLSAETSEPATRFCINLSPASVMDEQFHSDLQRLLSRFPGMASRLALEVPEFALANIESSLARLALQLKPLGVAVGVDQVGTGSMAFAYLQRLPLDYLRIDGSFNRGLHRAQDHKFFIQSMVQIAHNLDLQVLGEGLEEAADINTLRLTGVDGMSGYYFSRPIADLAQALSWRLT